MDTDITVDMLAFNLKMLAKKSKKSILVSAGNLEDKKRMLPYFKKLTDLNVSFYATAGTSRFLHMEGVDNIKIYKIAERDRRPNIETFLRHDRFDLVINVLVGDHDYDEASDSNLIRALSIENGIPLITDTDVAIKTIEQMVRKRKDDNTKNSLGNPREPWNMKSVFFQLVERLGGFACHHAHFDKAFLISLENLKLGQVSMQKKWGLYKYLKENYTYEDLIDRIYRGVQTMIDQGATYCKTFVDADSTVKLLPVRAALEVKARVQNEIELDIATQPLQGVLDRESRKYFIRASEMADCVGGLPSRDRPEPEKHLDFIMSLARDLNKTLDVHVDQENNPDESETELLAVKTMEHGLEGRVRAVHAISVAAKHIREQNRIIDLIKQAGLGVVVCPSAALSMIQLHKDAPLHNSIAPVPKLVEAGIPVYLGADNIADIFMPFVDGNLWTECRVLMEACRYYDIEVVARIACNRDRIQPATDKTLFAEASS